MPYGTHKLLGAASTANAWKEWNTLRAWCEQNGHAELASQHAPKEGSSYKKVDKAVAAVRTALGVPVLWGWKVGVLDGLTPEPQLPPAEPRPSRPAAGQTYTQRVWTAYRAVAEEMQTPDVPIHAIHRRVGGSLLDLQNLLRAGCRAHRAVPLTGEPAFAGDAARQSALCLPGETGRATGKPQLFLLIKLIDPPPMTQEQRPRQPPRSGVGSPATTWT